MLVEFVFHRHELDVDARQAQNRIETKLATLPFVGKIDIKSVTVMSTWFAVLIDFPDATEFNQTAENLLDSVAGAVVREFIADGVRFRGFEIHGKGGESLIFKEKPEP